MYFQLHSSQCGTVNYFSTYNHTFIEKFRRFTYIVSLRNFAAIKYSVFTFIMGLDSNGTKFLLYAKHRQGVSFERTAMIGRQVLNLDAGQLRDNLRKFDVQNADSDELLKSSDGYAEPFIKTLGAREIASFDASNYENASHVHDFNTPIPDEFKNKFTAVLDGGTLEHIFNFPTAIKNCMQMVEIGGHFLAITPTNNFLGHGFYQFSPELYFRIFNEQNGFKMRQTIVFEDFPESDWFEVTDPDAIKGRVVLTNSTPSYLLIIAEKVADVPLFEITPQQSDYSAMWQSSKENGVSAAANKLNGGSNTNLFLRLSKSALIRFRRRFGQRFGELATETKYYEKLDI